MRLPTSLEEAYALLATYLRYRQTWGFSASCETTIQYVTIVEVE